MSDTTDTTDTTMSETRPPTPKRRKLALPESSTSSIENNADEESKTQEESPAVVCNVCRLTHLTKECPVIKGNILVQDTKLPPKALLTLPDSLDSRELPDGKYDILAKETIVQGTQFGPMDAPTTKNYRSNWKFALMIFKPLQKRIIPVYLDTSDPNKCNWMTLVRFTSDTVQRNCICYQLDASIYFTVVKEIQSGDPLVVSYSPGYETFVKGIIKHQKTEATTVVAPPTLAKGVIQKKSPTVVAPPTLVNGIIQRQKESTTVVAPPDSSEKETEHVDREHDYSSTPQVPRRSERIRKVKVPDDDFVTDSLSITVKAEQDETIIQTEVGTKDQGPRDDDDTYEFKDEDYGIEEDREEGSQDRHVSGNPVALENKRKEKLRRLGAVLALEEWECKFCGLVVEEIEEFAVHLIRHYRKVGVARTEKARIGRLSNCTNDPVAADSNPNPAEGEGNTGEDAQDQSNESFTLIYGVNVESQIVETETERVEKAMENMDIDGDHTDQKTTLDTDGIATGGDTGTVAAATDENGITTGGDIEIVAATPDKDRVDTDGITTGGDIETVVATTDEDRVDTDGIPTGGDTEAVAGPTDEPEPKFPYVCDICVSSRVFNRAEYLIRHLKKHAGEYFCFECGVTHKSAASYTSHACHDAASGRRPPVKSECTICGKEFRSQRNLNNHLQMQHGKTYSCPNCSRVFLTEEKVNSHSCRGQEPEKEPEESLDTVDEVYLCGVCKESFPLLTQLEKHLRTHGCTIACSICAKALSHSKLKTHMAICETLQAYSNVETDELRCPTCAVVCDDLLDFRDHMTRHTHPFMCPSCTLRLPTRADIKSHECVQFQCDGCSEYFERFVDLKRHMASDHPDVEYFCYECAIPFVTQEGFLNHQTCAFDPTISVDTTKPSKKKTRRYQDGNFMCEECGAIYTKWSSYKTHRATHGPRRFVCEECGKKFHRREMLAEHIFVHQPPQFECADCGKKMKSKKSLEIHAQIHKGIKRFACQHCGKAFTQKINLTNHEMTHVPLDDKCFQCHYCSKKFSSKEYLGFHIEAHETGRNQVCDICNRSFVKPHMLMQHKRAAHGTQRYNCEYCSLVVKQKHSLQRHLEKRHEEHRSVWEEPGYLEARYVPGAGGFVHPEESQKSATAEYEENFEISDQVDEEVEEEQCVVENAVEESEEVVEQVGHISDSERLLPNLQVILSDGGENMVELEAINHLEGQEMYQPDADGNIIISDPGRVMILQMEEGGEFVLALAHSEADVTQILQGNS